MFRIECERRKMITEKTRLGLQWNIKHAEMIVVAVLVFAFMTQINMLILIAFCVACALVIFSSDEDSINYVAFFTSFSGIFVYHEKHMYFVLVSLFILKFLVNKRIPQKTFAFYIIIAAYSLMFSNIDNGITFTNLMGILLLFAIPVIAAQANIIDCRKMMQHYIFGFVLATIIGFFVKKIPSMAALFEYDLMWTEDYIELTRFCGLAFDSNFYALSNYIIIAYLLLAFDKLGKFRIVVVLFLIIAGLQTISKSYFLVLGIVLCCYLLKNVSNIKQLVISLIALGIAGTVFIFVSNKIGYNVVQLVTDRFVKGGSIADNTTGRTDIWGTYFAMFKTASIKEFMFGFGINATVTRAAHNTFIEYMFYYGFVGCFMWIAYFVYCGKLFCANTRAFQHKSTMVMICLMLGIFFLSAYTYEAFWIGLVVSFLTIGRSKKENMQYV